MRFETGTEKESDWLLTVSRLEDSAGWMDGWLDGWFSAGEGGSTSSQQQVATVCIRHWKQGTDMNGCMFKSISDITCVPDGPCCQFYTLNRPKSCWQVPPTTASPSVARRQLWDLAAGRSVGRLSSAVFPNNTFALAVRLSRSLLCLQRRVPWKVTRHRRRKGSERH